MLCIPIGCSAGVNEAHRGRAPKVARKARSCRSRDDHPEQRCSTVAGNSSGLVLIAPVAESPSALWMLVPSSRATTAAARQGAARRRSLVFPRAIDGLCPGLVGVPRTAHPRASLLALFEEFVAEHVVEDRLGRNSIPVPANPYASTFFCLRLFPSLIMAQ